MSQRRKDQKAQREQNRQERRENLQQRLDQNKGQQVPPMARETEAPKGKQGRTINLGKKKGQKKSGNSGNQENRRAA